jgi:hypothetical protein
VGTIPILREQAPRLSWRPSEGMLSWQGLDGRVTIRIRNMQGTEVRMGATDGSSYPTAGLAAGVYAASVTALGGAQAGILLSLANPPMSASYGASPARAASPGSFSPAAAKTAGAYNLSCYKTGYARADLSADAGEVGISIKLSADPTGIGYHDFLYAAEGQNTLYLVRKGKVTWSWVKPDHGEFGDISLLANGNIVFARGRVGASVMGMGQDTTPIWRFKPRDGDAQVHASQPIGLDKVLIQESGIPAQATLWNTVTDTKLWSMDIPTKEPVATTSVHGQIRHIRLLKNGHLLVAHLNLGKISEYDTATKKEIWTCPAVGPWGAVRLDNGNTLISGNDAGWVREIDNSCATKWEVTKTELPGITLKRVQECMRLKNGNTIINCASATGPNDAQVVEVTPEKKVVWVLKSWAAPILKGGSSTHILDEPGLMENFELMR